MVTLVIACGDDGGTDGAMDSGPRVDTGPLCTSDSDCDDGTFCNGTELCMPGATSADSNGCITASNPCTADQMCDEEADACLTTDCGEEADFDDDGHDSLACGGDDCDDRNPNRYPGNPEVCDLDGLDEDCDPDTLAGTADGDLDGDGFVSERCCYDPGDGTPVTCGPDCNDENNTANPGVTEDICDGGADNDCDGVVDEDPQRAFLPDVDGDDAPDRSVEPVFACGAPPGYILDTGAEGDCNDLDAAEAPTNGTDICANGKDDDCDGTVDNGTGCACSVAGVEQACGGGAVNTAPSVCREGMQTCLMGGTWTECSGSTPPASGGEVCDAARLDEDCDGFVNESPGGGDRSAEITCWRDGDGDDYASSSAESDSFCACPNTPGNRWTSREPTAGATDCNDGDPAINPAATELCDGVDNDCQPSAVEDADGDGYVAEGHECSAGTLPKTDCDDTRASVGPEAGYNMCPRRCSSSGTVVVSTVDGSCFCSGGLPVWDWNCSGTTDPAPRRPASIICGPGSDGQVLGVSNESDRIASNCGRPVDHDVCRSRATTPEPRILRCR